LLSFILTEKGKDGYRNESYDLWRDEKMINIKEKKWCVGKGREW